MATTMTVNEIEKKKNSQKIVTTFSRVKHNSVILENFSISIKSKL